MEIITTVVYDGHRHSLNAFVKKHIKIMIIPMMPAKVVHDAMNNRNMIDTISVILQYNWIPGRLKEGATTGQRTYLKLAGGLQAVVHLIINSAGDRLCMIDIIEPEAPRALIVAYVGNRAAFDTYMREMNITELELYSRLKHLEED
jgi:hypothetical protein